MEPTYASFARPSTTWLFSPTGSRAPSAPGRLLAGPGPVRSLACYAVGGCSILLLHRRHARTRPTGDAPMARCRFPAAPSRGPGWDVLRGAWPPTQPSARQQPARVRSRRAPRPFLRPPSPEPIRNQIISSRHSQPTRQASGRASRPARADIQPA
eukprot:scaffold92528_cov36-Prasinocladus_malaysianus.AAC.2